MGFDACEVLAIGNKHCQKHDPIWGQVMYLHVMVLKEISDELVGGHLESTAKEVDEDYNLARIRGGHVKVPLAPVIPQPQDS